RRGLSFAQSQAMKKQLWLVILKAGQQRNNSKPVQEAQQALKAF
ncbi:tetratricopeptide repeat protein, partial [Acinetobacter baumannii]